MIVSFDFDGTLHREGRPLHPGVSLVQWHASRGDTCWVLTSRNPEHEEQSWWKVNEPNRVCVACFLERFDVPASSILFTNHELKAQKIQSDKIDLHYDDDPHEIAAARAAGLRVVYLNGVTLDDLDSR